jgi:hypothetical protein
VKSTGARVVDDGPNRGKTLFELGYDSALAATRVQFDRLVRVLSAQGAEPGENRSSASVPLRIDRFPHARR